MNTKLLVAGCVTVMSVALVSAQSGQSVRPATAAKPATSQAQIAQPAVAKAKPATATSAADVANYRALLDQYCVTCHNARLKTANLLLDQLDLAHLSENSEIGEKVVRKLRAGMMPPTNMKRPDAATLDGFVHWMEGELDRGAITHLPAPGLHRLNRTEYANAIRDLLGLEVDPSKFLPSDDSTHGFDNQAGALTMSPALMEAYLSAAGKISRLAIGDITAPTQGVFEVPPDTAQNYHIEGLPFGTRGGTMIPYEFPVDGEYTFKVKGVTGYFQAVLGQIKGEQLEVTVDGERVRLFDWDREIANTGNSGGRSTQRIPIKAGHHTVGVTFLATNDIPGSELNKPFQRTMNTPGTIPGFQFYPHVGQVVIEGPYGAAGSTDTASRRKIFVCRPALASEEAACSRRIISTLVKHAFRRPVTPADLELLNTFYLDGRKDGGTFDDGIEVALQRILADVEFVYRGEGEPAGLAAGKSYRVGDLAMASRLSFFLWSSIPDDELIDIAAQGRLKDPVVFEQQVKRMLKDPKSSALINNFSGQWLSVRSLAASEPVVNLFPDFDDNLRTAFQREMELFFGSVVREDRSILDLLTADYTFVNERLAKHYGIPNVYGPQFRRVTLGPNQDMRKGLLGKGALLTLTSQAARTSPVYRGKWFLVTFLGVAPPDPPPNVNTTLKEKPADVTGNSKIPSMREIMQAHHENPTCNTCHQIFEPIGLAMENFDPIGSWRTDDDGVPIDTVGKLVDGSPVDGVASLRTMLVRRSDTFARVATEKLLTYALGRGVEYEDMPLLRSIVKDATPGNYKFSSLILGIVKSPAFQMNMKMTDARSNQRAAR